VRKKKRKPYPDYWEWRESRTARRQDELHYGERVAATLRWQSMFNYLAHAQTSAGAWTFDRPRILSHDVEVREAATATVVAVVHFKWTGDATLEFADGGRLDWAPTNFWQTQWAFFSPASSDDKDRALIVFDDTSGFLEARSAVSYRASDLTAEESALLTTLGRYLMMLHRRDSAAVAATAATAATG
jgi:hypothetical protein